MAAGVWFLVGCTSSSSEDSEGASSCARMVSFDDRVDSDVANVELTVGDRLGTGRFLICDGTGGRGEQSDSADVEEQTVYQIDGLSIGVAVAVGDCPSGADFFALYKGKKLPAAVRTFIDKQ